MVCKLLKKNTDLLMVWISKEAA